MCELVIPCQMCLYGIQEQLLPLRFTMEPIMIIQQNKITNDIIRNVPAVPAILKYVLSQYKGTCNFINA